MPGEFLCRLVGLTAGEGFLASSPRLRAAADVRNDRELAASRSLRECGYAEKRAKQGLSQDVLHEIPGKNFYSTNASASISTRISGEMSAATWTIEVAGRTLPKNSPWAFPTFSHSAMLTT